MRSLFMVINRNRFYVGAFFLIAAGYIGIVEYSKHDCLSRGGSWHSGFVAGQSSFWCEER